MKILLTMNLPYFPAVGGANKANRSLAEEFVRRGHTVQVVVPALGTPSRLTQAQFLEALATEGIQVTARAGADVFHLNGVEVHAVAEPPRLGAYLTDQLRAFKPDWALVSSEDPSQRLLEIALQGCPDRVVYLVHTLMFLPFGPQAFFPSARRAKLFSQIRLMVAVSAFVRDYLRQWSGLESTVVYMSVYGSGPFSSLGHFENDFVTLVNPCAIKGISIFEGLARALPEIQFAAVPTWGTTPADCARLTRLPNVQLLEPQADFDRILARTRVTLVPSLVLENFSLTVVESMLRGIPVLGSRVGGIPEAKLGTDFLLPVQPIERFTDQLDENNLPIPIVPEQDLRPWRAALSQLLSEQAVYEQHSRAARAAALPFVSGLSLTPLEELLVRLSAEAPPAVTVLDQPAPAETSAEAESSLGRAANLTLEQRALLMLRLRKKSSEAADRQGQDERIPAAPREGALPLSFAQQRLWFLDQINPHSPVYNLFDALRFRGLLNQAVLERSFNALVQRHEILRTTFPAVRGEPVQQIAPTASIEVTVRDVSHLSEAERDLQTRTFIKAETHQPFDLAHGPLLRIHLLRLAADDHLLLLTFHHILADGWSTGILLRELSALYSAFSAGAASAPLPEMPIQYADYALWERNWLENEGHLAEQLAFWKLQLANEPLQLDLPLARPRPPVQTYAGAVQPLKLSAALSRALGQLSQQESATLFMTVLAAFQAFLYRYTGQTDIAIGTPVAGRTRAEVEGLIGFFVNTLVLRTQVSGALSFRELTRRVREVALEAYAHQATPFEKIVEALQPERDLSRNPFFQVMFILDKDSEAPPFSGLTTELVPLENRTAKFDLTLTLVETDQGLRGDLRYNVDLFEADTIARMATHFQNFLEQVVAAPAARLSDLPLLTDGERRQVLVDWNATAVAYPPAVCIHELFEAQAARTPTAPALRYEGQTLTYAELNTRAEQLAHYLRGMGVGPEVRVGLCLERSLEMVIGLLGILKAGGAYVPLDPSYPAERLAYMLEDSRVTVLLTQSGARDWGLGAGHPFPVTVCLDTEWETISSFQSPAINPQPLPTPDSLIYLIYTSGSTGKPKGAMNSHRGLYNRLVWMQAAYQLTEADRVLQKTPFSFDVSGWEFFWPLITGACLVIARPGGHQDSRYLAELIIQEQITTLHFVPSMLQIFLEEPQVAQCQSLQRVICSGEALPVDVQNRFYARLSAELHNLYGPTEAAIDVTAWACGPDPERRSVPIGRPIANIQTYILDAQMQPVPVGVPGELYLGGVGVGRGYLGRPELTAEKFIPNPFVGMHEKAQGARHKAQENPNSLVLGPWPLGLEPYALRLYKTGDLARYLPDGNIEFLGRLDHQVKVRGFRIELGEIEAALARQAAVREVVVVARETGRASGDKQLVAYLSLHAGATVTTSELRSFLQPTLPEYMLPGAFVFLDALPLNPNGKVDRRQLPDPGSARPELEKAYSAPRTPVEEILAGMWVELLKLERVGREDNFFELGGHSLLATQVISRLRESFHIELPLRRLFESPVLSEFAEVLEAARLASPELSVMPLEHVADTENLPLSFAQQRLWFLDQLEPGNAAYHMPNAVRLNGSLNTEALEHSLNTLIQRHAVLRTSFPLRDGEPIQAILAELRLTLSPVDMSHLPDGEREAEVRRLGIETIVTPFDLANGPLIRVRLIRLAETEHSLIINLHHIISDGWSLGIFFRELAALYEAFAEGQPLSLPELPVQYSDFAHWQRHYLEGQIFEQQSAYWKQQLAGAPAALELPTARPRPSIQTFRGGKAQARLSANLSQALLTLSRREGVTLFMTLLATFQTLLARYSGQADVVVGTPIAGRTRAETEGLIGCFLNTLALRTDLREAGNPRFREVLSRVREVALGAYAHQDLPFERLLEELQPVRDLSRTPVFQVLFNMLNLDSQPMSLTGLEIKPIAFRDEGEAKFDLTVYAGEREGVIDFTLVYNADLFDAPQMAQFLEHFQGLLEAVAADPDLRLAELPLSPPSIRTPPIPVADLIQSPDDFVDFSAAELEQTIPARFEAQVRREPERLAVKTMKYSLSYAELNAAANNVAHAILARRGEVEERTALLFDHDAPMVIGLLGALKAGKTYVPLDPTYPPDRLTYMVQDSQASLILTDEDHLPLATTLAPDGVEILLLDEGRTTKDESPWSLVLGPSSSVHRLPSFSPDRLAYLLYTSGSTGQPKGVMQNHRNVLHHIRAYTNNLHLSSTDRLTLFSSYSFDAAVMDIFGALLNGATLYPYSIKVSGVDGLSDWLVTHAITLYHSTPTVFRYFVETLSEGTKDQGPRTKDQEPSSFVVRPSSSIFPRLRLIILGGEEAQRRDAEAFQRHFGPACRLINGLGPTESTVSLQYVIDHANAPRLERPSLPVGYPVDRTEVLLLTDVGEQAAVYGLGEITLRSPHLALGYWRLPELTEERFIQAQGARPKAQGLESLRLYRTGDLGRWLPDGSLEFVGRRDFQVKVRGYRVEIGEIETRLLRLPGVKAAVVTAQTTQRGESQLVAYMVAAPGAVLVADELRRKLAEQLPDYMVPVACLLLDELPLTPTGKVDRRSLPKLELSEGTEQRAPRNPVEDLLVGIYSELLGLEQVGIEADFFVLGGHSLLATRVISRIRALLNVELPLRTLFESPTIAGLAERIARAQATEAEVVIPPLKPVSRAAPQASPLPLSFAQQRLWFLDQLEPGNPSYHLLSALRLTGSLDVEKLERAFDQVVQRHESLRTVFPNIAGEPIQQINPAFKVAIPVTELPDLSEAEQAVTVERLIREELHRPFDLAEGPLLHVRLLRLSESEHVLILVFHHIISDAWSIGLLIRELSEFYTDDFPESEVSRLRAKSGDFALRELPIQYADYAVWEREWLQGQALERHLNYWKQQLAGAPPLLKLPTDYPRPPFQSSRGARQALTIAAELTAALKSLSRQTGTTLYMILLAAFQTLLARYSGQTDVVIGSSIATRQQAEVESLIGCFVNTLTLRGDLSENPTFRELLSRTREAALGAFAHQALPFEQLVEALQLGRNLSQNPLFQVMFVLQNAPRFAISLPGLTLQPIGIESGTAQFDLTLYLWETTTGMGGGLEYSTDLFEAATISRLLEHFQLLLETVVAQPDQRLWDVPLLTETERRQLLTEWNVSRAEYPRGLCIHQYFEAQAARTPEATAISLVSPTGEIKLSYRELNEKANQLAHYLIQLGIGPESFVGLCVERSLEMAVGLLGILKAGGAYVPLDPSYPEERLAFMLADARVSVIVTKSWLLERLPILSGAWRVEGGGAVGYPPSAICLDTDWPTIAQSSIPKGLSVSNPQSPISSRSPAYIIYTSGSTGTPKGVVIQQGGLVNHSHAIKENYALQSSDRVLQFASISFDVAAEEFYPSWLSGAAVVFRPDQLGSFEEFQQFVAQERLTVLNLPTPFWQEWVLELLRQPFDSAQGKPGAALPESLRLVIIGNEKGLPERVESWQALTGGRIQLKNAYGPTEATITTTVYDPPDITPGAVTVPIGRPLSNVEVYLLDSHLQPVPIGMPGELYVGGIGLARGYLGRPELTAEKFIPNPFAGMQEKAQGARLKAQGEESLVLGPWPLALESLRLYRSGDLARYLPDGNIEFLGRVDHQVKVRGFRIELGEIEIALGQHPTVRQAVVTAREDIPGEVYLAAYLVADQSPASVSELREMLKSRVPDYMIPSAFVWLNTLPLLPNGKLDRGSLPAPASRDALLESSVEFVAPGTAAEVALAGIWSEVLRRERIGIHDNFFDLGGHSLLATQVISRVREALQVELPLRTLFESATLADLAQSIEAILGSGAGLSAPPLRPVAREAGASGHSPLPLSFAQQRLWFLDQFEPNSSVYNIPSAYRLVGPLDVSALERAFNAILERHEILRTTFAVEADWPVQVIAPVEWRSLRVVDLSMRPADERDVEARRWMKEEAHAPCSLTHGPLIRLTLLHLEPEVYAFLFTIHHIISDGWSLDIFWHELITFYEGFANDQSVTLSALPIQYADFAAWQRNWLQGEVLETHLAYWKRHLADAPPVLELPTDRPRPATQTFHGARQPLALSLAASEALKALSDRAGATLFMTLVAAFQTLLARYTRQEDIVVGTPIAGRNRAEVEELIGFFVNTLVLRTDLSGNPTFRELLQRVREVALEAYTHQDVPFEKLVEELQPERKLSHSPLFQALFVLQNESAEDWKFSNLSLTPWGVKRETVMFDLTLDLSTTPDGLRGQFGYNTDLFDASTIARLAEHFRVLLEGIAAHPDKRLADLPLLTEAEMQKLLGEWNATEVAYPQVQCLHELFEAQVERTPEATAVVYEDQQYTYRELNTRANQLAHYLQGLGVGPEVAVGLYLERSLEMLVGLLGILKSGGAYVPLDVGYPEERIAYVVEDARIGVVVTQSRLLAEGGRWLLENLEANQLSVANRQLPITICLDTDWETITTFGQPPTTSNQPPATSDQLAYLIYTSGSTGQPKGVAVEHRQIFNYLQSILERLNLPPGASYATVSTFAADLGNTVVFPSLVTGGCLHIISQERAADPEALADYFSRHPIDCLKIVPSHLAALLNAARPEQVLPRRRLVLGGEASRSEWVAELHALAPDCAILNHYGPTETTIGVLTHEVQPESLSSAPPILPLGRPLNNTQIYILDAHLQPVPLGVPGELYIGGEGLTRGYLGRPELTAERFIPNPFAGMQEKAQGARRKAQGEESLALEPWPLGLAPLRLYRTGDLARYLPDGNIEFLGRVDHQVKIRGFRIELPEIEARLREHPEVQDAVVIKREDMPGDPRLVAYVVPIPDRVPAVNGRRRYRLPNNLGVVQLNKNETDYIYREIFELQAYLRHGITLRDGDCIFDVGANIGLFTLFTHQMCRSPRVYAFEPNPTVAQILRANATLHAPGTNVFECGVSSENKTAEFTFFSGFSLLSGFYADAATEKQVVKNFMQNQQEQGAEEMRELVEEADELLEERFAVNTFTTQLKTLSTLIRELGIERIDLLKINVEKSEFDVLLGIEAEDWSKIAQIVLEVDLREHLDAIVNLLEGQGYELYVEQDVLLQNTQLCYIYAIRPSAERRLIREQAIGEQVRPIPLLPEPFLTSVELRSFLSPQVPDYMVPSAFVLLEALPLNANGKLDRRALSAVEGYSPDHYREGRQTTFAPPRTPVEEKVAEIWRELLHVERVGLRDNFFELGGHSLLATQAIARVRKAFQVELPVRSLFEAPALVALAERIMQTELEQADSEMLARMLAELGMVS